MPYSTITIASTPYEVFADVSAANSYLAASFHADDWNASDDDEKKGRALITMTRLLDRQRWLGDKTDAAQALSWPRANTGLDGVEDNVIPSNITLACIEGALALFNGSDMQSTQNQSQKIQSLNAGSASLTYFRGAEGQPTRFPQIIHELLRDYLTGGRLSVVGVATGVDAESVTGQDFNFNRGL